MSLRTNVLQYVDSLVGILSDSHVHTVCLSFPPNVHGNSGLSRGVPLPVLWILEPGLVGSRCHCSGSRLDSVSVSAPFCPFCLCGHPERRSSAVAGSGGLGLGAGGFDSAKPIFFEALTLSQVSPLVA